MIILPGCCQWVACNSVSPLPRKSYEHAGALTPALSFSLLLLSLCRPGKPRGWIVSEKEHSFVPGRPQSTFILNVINF